MANMDLIKNVSETVQEVISLILSGKCAVLQCYVSISNYLVLHLNNCNLKFTVNKSNEMTINLLKECLFYTGLNSISS